MSLKDYDRFSGVNVITYLNALGLKEDDLESRRLGNLVELYINDKNDSASVSRIIGMLPLPNLEKLVIGAPGVLLADWEKIAAQLTKSRITQLELYCPDIDEEVLRVIVSGLKGSSVASMCIMNTQIADITELAEVLPWTEIIHLWLYCNKITKLDALAKALANSDVKYVGLWENSSPDKELTHILNARTWNYRLNVSTRLVLKYTETHIDEKELNNILKVASFTLCLADTKLLPPAAALPPALSEYFSPPSSVFNAREYNLSARIIRALNLI